MENNKKISNTIEKKYRKLRDELWPKLEDDDLWSRKEMKGFTTVPRTLPYIGQLMDELSNGKPLSSTYIALWCRVFDSGLLIIENPIIWANEAGFSGTRAENTWKMRMKILKEFCFIKATNGSSGEFHYVLLMNPYKVIEKLKEKFSPQKYSAFFDRALNIGAIK